MPEAITFNNGHLSSGAKVPILRISRCWTQADLAYEAKIPQYQISALERNLKVYPAAKRRILAVLELDDDSEST